MFFMVPLFSCVSRISVFPMATWLDLACWDSMSSVIMCRLWLLLGLVRKILDRSSMWDPRPTGQLSPTVWAGVHRTLY